MRFCGILRKILNPVPNSRLPVYLQHFAILNNTYCENLAKIRVIGIIWRIMQSYFNRKKKKNLKKAADRGPLPAQNDKAALHL